MTVKVKCNAKCRDLRVMCAHGKEHEWGVTCQEMCATMGKCECEEIKVSNYPHESTMMDEVTPTVEEWG